MFQAIRRHKKESFVLFMELILALSMFVAGLTVSQGLPLQLNNPEANVDPNILNANETASMKILALNKELQHHEGDIVPASKYTLWPIASNGTVTVIYYFNPVVDNYQKILVRKGFSHLEYMTCVRFVDRYLEREYVLITSGRGCSTVIGRTGGEQVMTLSRYGCLSISVILHQLMHLLGFHHEQSRSDRDKYVDIKWQYINQDMHSHFDKENTNVAFPYDYSSLMHLPTDAFTNTPGKATLVPKPNPNVQVGQRAGLSHLDLKKINSLYKCNVCRTKLSSSSGSFSSDGIKLGPDGKCVWYIQIEVLKKAYLQLTVQNIPSSPGCSDSYIKIYDGPDTDAKVFMDKICGSVKVPPLISKAEEIIVEFVSNKDPALSKFSGVYKTVDYGGTFYSDDEPLMSPMYFFVYVNNMHAVYSLIAPAQSKVSLEFTSFWMQFCKFTCSCICDYVVVIDGPSLDSPKLGKFCGFVNPPKLVSTGNVMLVIFHTDHILTSRGFLAKFKFVSG